MRTRALSLPRPLSIAILISFALALVVGALPAQAAPKGSVIKPTLVSENTLVSPGELAAFRSTFSNTGPSTINDLTLVVAVAGGTVVTSALPAGCSATTTGATCAIGTVSSGAPAVVHLLQVTADEFDTGVRTLSVTATYSGDARQNNQQAAKRDTWGPITASTVVDSSAEVYGAWQNPHDPKPYPGVVGALQRTDVAVPAIDNAYAALVRHLDQNIDCGPGPDLAGFGKAVELRVNNGSSPVDVTITYNDEADAPSPSQIEIVHQLNNGTCVFPVRDCEENPTNVAGCYDAFTTGTGQNKLTVVHMQLPSNGRVKGT